MEKNTHKKLQTRKGKFLYFKTSVSSMTMSLFIFFSLSISVLYQRDLAARGPLPSVRFEVTRPHGFNGRSTTNPNNPLVLQLTFNNGRNVELSFNTLARFGTLSVNNAQYIAKGWADIIAAHHSNIEIDINKNINLLEAIGVNNTPLTQAQLTNSTLAAILVAGVEKHLGLAPGTTQTQSSPSTTYSTDVIAQVRTATGARREIIEGYPSHVLSLNKLVEAISSKIHGSVDNPSTSNKLLVRLDAFIANHDNKLAVHTLLAFHNIIKKIYPLVVQGQLEGGVGTYQNVLAILNQSHTFKNALARNITVHEVAEFGKAIANHVRPEENTPTTRTIATETEISGTETPITVSQIPGTQVDTTTVSSVPAIRDLAIDPYAREHAALREIIRCRR